MPWCNQNLHPHTEHNGLRQSSWLSLSTARTYYTGRTIYGIKTKILTVSILLNPTHTKYYDNVLHFISLLSRFTLLNTSVSYEQNPKKMEVSKTPLQLVQMTKSRFSLTNVSGCPPTLKQINSFDLPPALSGSPSFLPFYSVVEFSSTEHSSRPGEVQKIVGPAQKQRLLIRESWSYKPRLWQRLPL